MLTTDSNAPMPSKLKITHSNNFQFNTTILSNEVTPRSDRHQNQQIQQICIILQIIVKHFKYKIILSRPNNNTMDNLATWMTYKMYQSYILGISFKPEFYKSGLSLPGMFANIWIGQRDFELTSPNSLFQISISWYHRQVHRKTLYTGLRRQTKAQGTHPFSKAGLTGAQVARLFIGAPDKRGQEF